LDTAANYTFVSPRSKEILGYEPQEIAAMGFAHCAHPEDMPSVQALYADIVRRTPDIRLAGSSRAPQTGEWRRIRFNFSPLSDEKGNTEGVVLSAAMLPISSASRSSSSRRRNLPPWGQMLPGWLMS